MININKITRILINFKNLYISAFLQFSVDGLWRKAEIYKFLKMINLLVILFILKLFAQKNIFKIDQLSILTRSVYSVLACWKQTCNGSVYPPRGVEGSLSLKGLGHNNFIVLGELVVT